MFGPCFVIRYFVSFKFCNDFAGEVRVCCSTLNVFLMYYNSQCSVALPHGAVGWSVVCDCGIS